MGGSKGNGPRVGKVQICHKKRPKRQIKDACQPCQSTLQATPTPNGLRGQRRFGLLQRCSKREAVQDEIANEAMGSAFACLAMMESKKRTKEGKEAGG